MEPKAGEYVVVRCPNRTDSIGKVETVQPATFEVSVEWQAAFVPFYISTRRGVAPFTSCSCHLATDNDIAALVEWWRMTDEQFVRTIEMFFGKE